MIQKKFGDFSGRNAPHGARKKIPERRTAFREFFRGVFFSQDCAGTA
ncbi:hypothetical protein HMPREF7215_0725 [Pyramidobacter piscolens W5455]|uniref:Uncharacterized protein n=1 Tax=Pyramidobacter piscolens W5455 TaxID=352165 RepID=A0ABM9ZUM2_9BACT|nr:hypothetical protein HMPREF7215_0725 [Pyramidobacter piscolens W5455]